MEMAQRTLVLLTSVLGFSEDRSTGPSVEMARFFICRENICGGFCRNSLGGRASLRRFVGAGRRFEAAGWFRSCRPGVIILQDRTLRDTVFARWRLFRGPCASREPRRGP